MPGGATALGYAYFAGIKAGGYTLYAKELNRRYDPSVPPSVWKVGLTRTAIGMIVGAVYFGLISLVSERLADALGATFLIGLIPFRIFEWYFLIWLFYRMEMERKGYCSPIVWGVIVSFVLDAIGIVAAFVIPGGFWIC
jgi:hypothetical protein